MVPEGVVVPSGHQEVELGWSEEGCDLIEVIFFDEGPPELGVPGVEMEHGVPYIRGCLRGVHPDSRGYGGADTTTIVQGC